MTTYFSPDGNPEVWETKPEGYFTEDEWLRLHPEPIIIQDEEFFSTEPDLGSRINALEDIFLALLKGELNV